MLLFTIFTIFIFQLITVEAIRDLNPLYLAMKTTSTSTRTNMRDALLINAMHYNVLNETTLKNYADKSLKVATTKHMRNFPCGSPLNKKYKLMGEFLNGHLNGIGLIYRLQELGNKDSKEIVEYSITVQTAYYFYIFRLLVECNGETDDQNKKSIPFDTLYTYIVNLISTVGTATEQKNLIDLINEILDETLGLIKTYWKDNLSELKPIGEMDENVANTKTRNKNKLQNVLNEICISKNITYEAYMEIETFHSMICGIQLFLKKYIIGMVKLNLDTRNTAFTDSVDVGWTHIESYLSLVSFFIRDLYCLSIGAKNIDSFLEAIGPDSVTITEDENIRSDSSTNIAEDLLEMLVKTQQPEKEVKMPRLSGDRRDGCVLEFDREPIILSYSSDDDSYSDESNNEDPIKNPKIIDDKINTDTTWIKWGLLVSVILALIVLISSYVHSVLEERNQRAEIERRNASATGFPMSCKQCIGVENE